MGAHKLVCRCLHDLFIQMTGVKPGAIDIEWIPDAGIIDSIGILFTDTGTDGIEVFVDFQRFCHHDVHREVGIESVGQAIRGNGGVRSEVRHIHPCVDTGIRTAAPSHMNIMTHDHGNSFFQSLLNSSQIFLSLPAMVGSTLIGQK